MSLLKKLGLAPTEAILRRAALAAAADKPTEGKDVAVAKAATVGAPMARKASGDGAAFDAGKPMDAEKMDSADRDQADKLLPALAGRRKALADLSKKVEEGQAKVAKLLAAATPDKKKGLAESKLKLDAALTDIQAKLTQVVGDIEAIEDPHTSRQELVKILGRGDSKASMDEVTEVESALGMKGGPRNEVKQSTTTTSVKDGVGTVSKDEMSAKLGLDGLTVKKGQETERVWKDGAVKTSSETQVKVGPGGLAIDSKRTTEADFKGQTMKLEESESLELGKDGVKASETVKSTESDGSSTAVKKDSSVERGDGKLGLGKGKTVTTTDASGDALTKGAKGGAGMVAGKDGMGAYAQGQGEVGTQRKSGAYTGAVGGLHGNVTCNIGDPKGEPPLYPLTLVASLGADITLKAGKAKQGAPGKAGVEVKLGAEVVMTVEHQLDETQLAAYVESLKSASKGGKVAGTALELRVIQAGITQGWPVAQALWKGKGAPLSKEMIQQLQRAGDSVTLQTTTTQGGKVAGDFKAVSIEAGAEQTVDHKTKATRNTDGDLDVETDAAETTKVSGKVGVSYGLVGGSAGKSHTVKTSFGFEITVDVKKDADGKALAELQALATNGTEAQYDDFIQRRKDRITVKGRKKGKAEADSDSVGLSVGGAEASIGLQSGVAEQVKTDGQGKLVESTVVGSAGSGGGIKLGDVVIGDSGSDEAVAQRSGDGDATLDLTHTKKQTSFSKLGKALKSKLPFMGEDKPKDGEKPAKPKGLLSAAAGGDKGETETESTDIYGIQLSKADLVKIGKIAFTESVWTQAPVRRQEYFDWKKVGKTIREAGGAAGVVADELAKFVGGDKINRLEVLNRLIRPPGQVAIGKAFEFPESLKGKKAEYVKLIDKACEEDVRKLATSEGPQRAGELGKQLFDKVEALRQAWAGATDFSKEGVRAEMLSAIAHRKTALTEAMREVAGKTSDADKKQAALEAFGRLNRECAGYRMKQDELFAKVNDLIGSRQFIAMVDRSDAEAPMRALSDMYAIWKRDMAEAIALAKANDIPEQRYKDNQPNQKEWEKLKKACMMSNY